LVIGRGFRGRRI